MFCEGLCRVSLAPQMFTTFFVDASRLILVHLENLSLHSCLECKFLLRGSYVGDRHHKNIQTAPIHSFVHRRPSQANVVEVASSQQLPNYEAFSFYSNQKGISTRSNRNPRRINARGVLLVQELTSVAYNNKYQNTEYFKTATKFSTLSTESTAALAKKIFNISQLLYHLTLPKFEPARSSV